MMPHACVTLYSVLIITGAKLYTRNDRKQFGGKSIRGHRRMCNVATHAHTHTKYVRPNPIRACKLQSRVIVCCRRFAEPGSRVATGSKSTTSICDMRARENAHTQTHNTKRRTARHARCPATASSSSSTSLPATLCAQKPRIIIIARFISHVLLVVVVHTNRTLSPRIHTHTHTRKQPIEIR